MKFTATELSRNPNRVFRAAYDAKGEPITIVHGQYSDGFEIRLKSSSGPQFTVTETNGSDLNIGGKIQFAPIELIDDELYRLDSKANPMISPTGWFLMESAPLSRKIRVKTKESDLPYEAQYNPSTDKWVVNYSLCFSHAQLRGWQELP